MFTPKRPEAHLLDRRAAQVAVGVGRVADRVLPALAGVRLAAEPVHGDRQRLVRLAPSEPSDIAPVTKRLTISLTGSILVERQPLVLGQLAELQQPAQRRPPRRVLVDQRRVLVVGRLAAVPDRVLEQRDRLRVPHVVLALARHGVDAADRQAGRR
jgi:hypothetical protein